jgi:hypothetical protein
MLFLEDFGPQCERCESFCRFLVSYHTFFSLLRSWTLGNLGRAGYGASLEGMWPYTYDTCDVGTVKNQTRDGLPIE